MDLLHAARPRRIVRVGFTLVQEHAFDDTVFLRFACGLHQALVGVHTIFLRHVHEPAAGRVRGLHRQIIRAGILVPKLEFRTRHGHIDHAHAITLRQHLDHLAAEEIHRAHVIILPANGRDGRVPVVPLTAIARHIHGGHELEARIVEVLVLFGRTGARLHVGLAEAKVDEEIMVGRLGFRRQAGGQHRQDQELVRVSHYWNRTLWVNEFRF